MKILVPIKRVIDYNVKIRLKSDGTGVETIGVKMSMNPFDEIAVEEAIVLKEKNIATEVIVVAIGNDSVQETLRSALAMGADRAIQIVTDKNLSPLQTAKLFKVIADEEKPNLIIIGKQSIDDDTNQVGQMLAALLNYGQATFASQVTIENNNAIVVREVDGGHTTVKLNLPAVITTDLRLNKPRYVTLPNIMKSRSKPIVKRNADDLGVNLTPHIIQQKVEEPKKRTAGIKVADAVSLVAALKGAGVI